MLLFLCNGLRETEKKKSPLNSFPLLMQNNSSFHAENVSPSDPTLDQNKVSSFHTALEKGFSMCSNIGNK